MEQKEGKTKMLNRSLNTIKLTTSHEEFEVKIKQIFGVFFFSIE